MTKPTFNLTPQEARAKWVEALRSGKYTQGRGVLTQLTGNGEHDCCFGVACKVFMVCEPGRLVRSLLLANDGIGKRIEYRDDSGCAASTGLPTRVLRWLGFKLPQPTCDECGGQVILANLNDCGATFSEIADIIESNPPGLFVE